LRERGEERGRGKAGSEGGKAEKVREKGGGR
jgi:hypothetical protein